jgi:acyl-homoserine lactone acylase PvdQ
MSVTTQAPRTLIAAFALIACAPQSPRAGNAVPSGTQGTVRDKVRLGYHATIRRTSYGIPHIQAANLPSLGLAATAGAASTVCPVRRCCLGPAARDRDQEQ